MVDRTLMGSLGISASCLPGERSSDATNVKRRRILFFVVGDCGGLLCLGYLVLTGLPSEVDRVHF